MDDLFGDASLFAEFEKDREADNSFIRYDENADRSKIIFEGFDESEDDESDIEWTQENDYYNVKMSTSKKEGGEVKKETEEEGLEVTKSKEDTDLSKPTNADHENNAGKSADSEESMEVESKIKEEETGSIEVEDENNPQQDQEAKLAEAAKSNVEDQDQNNKNEPTSEKIDNEVKKSLDPVKDASIDLAGNALANNNKDTSSVNKEGNKDKNGCDINKMLDDDDTAWLYEHLYKNEKVTKDSKQNMKQLIHERNKYHRYSKILDSTRYVPDEDSPAVQMIFNNTAFSRKYRQQIEQFVKGLLWQEFNSNNSETMTDIDIKPGAPSCIEINENLGPDQRNERMRQNHAILGSSQFHKQFLIDFLGWPFTVSEPPRCNINWEIPLYGQVFDEVYADPSSKPIKPAVKKQKPSCWNCGHDDHSVAQCRLPRNQARITQNRKEFMEQHQQNKTQPKFVGATRYHLDPEISSKFNKFRPGVISDELKEAMGLKSDQLPQHIYKMRLFGYPPGWLHEAKQVESGVSIYGKGGRVSLCTGENLEDGELKDAGSEKSEYDVNRIVEYPGFTIPTPLGIIDEHATYKMPPIQQHQLKKTLVSQSEEKTAAKKRKLEKLAEEKQKEETPTKKARLEITEDGEVDEENADNEEKLDKKEEDKEESETKDEEINGKEKDENKMDESKMDENKMDENKMDENEKEKEEVDSDATVDEDVPQTPTAVTRQSDSQTPKVQKDSQSSTISLSKDFGTPILVRHKNALPDASKFAVGAEDHIPFENLPDATGTFEKMKNILDIIRKKNKS